MGAFSLFLLPECYTLEEGNDGKSHHCQDNRNCYDKRQNSFNIHIL